MRRWSTIGLAFVLAAAAGLLVAVHLSNQRLADAARTALTATQAAAPDAASTPEDPAAALPALDALHASPLAGRDPEWWRRASLNAPRLDELAAETDWLDRDLLRDAFLRRFATRILHQIDRPDVEPELAFEGLKAALALGGAGPRQDALIRLWATVDWSLTEPQQRDRLLQILDRALAAEPRLTPAIDGEAVERIRVRLRQAPLSARAYAAIRTSDAAQALPAFRADLALGRESWAVTRRSGASLATPIPGLLTADGFHRVVVPALADLSGSLQADAWVLGDDARPEQSGQALTTAVLTLYLADVARAWDELLDDLELAPSRADPESAARMVGALATQQGPLLRLALAARTATQFDRAAGAEAEKLAALAEALGGRRPWAEIDRRYAWLLATGDGDLPGFSALVEATRPFLDRAGSLPADRTPAAGGFD
ncbi:ImcF-related family protein [Inquilinus limosus]|uniref:ImcF-related family protein n=1 Tax=Inquilinus limosus TaxID=171674 RepID=UPI00040A46CC|nr:ImcF-related family protein [Inquilinus limosus]